MTINACWTLCVYSTGLFVFNISSTVFWIADHPDYANISLTISEDTVTNHGLVYFNCSVGFELFGNYLLLYTPSNEVVSSQMPGFTVSSGSRWTSVTISPVQLAHAGEYTCVVTGRSVTERATKSLYVKCEL